jgi:hypothetical protein
VDWMEDLCGVLEVGSGVEARDVPVRSSRRSISPIGEVHRMR